jgi:hypothetical protein
MRTLNRLTPWLPFILVLAGSVLFIGGGRSHPHVGASMGAIGSPQYFLHFAQTIVSTPNWVPMHVMILVGPLLWALAGASIRDAMPARGSSLWGTAQTALTISATLWVVVFLFDGFIAPVFARAIVAASAGSIDPTLLASFGANQTSVIRLGLISWILGGVAITLFSIGLLVGRGQSHLAAPVGLLGIVVGAWPIVAALTGEFIPGPFTSDLWKWTALVTSIWYVALGVTLAIAPRPAITER